MQEQPSGDRLPLGYLGRTLTAAEKKYHVTERDCLAVVWAVTLLRPYLEGIHFVVRTDHAALRWILNLSTSGKRLERWRLRLLEYDFEVQYRPGHQHHAADLMSRLPSDGQDSDPIDHSIPCMDAACIHAVEESLADTDFSDAAEAEEPRTNQTPTDSTTALRRGQDTSATPISLEEFIREQAVDMYCRSLVSPEGMAAHRGLFDVDERGVLVRRAPLEGSVQIVVPESLRPRVLHLNHYPRLVGHPGGTRMHQTMRRTYYWPYMSMDAYQTVRECVSCQLNRIKERKHTNFCKLFPAVSPLEFICIDILGPLPKTRKGNTYLLVMCDRFSKLTRRQHLKRISTEAVAEAF